MQRRPKRRMATDLNPDSDETEDLSFYRHLGFNQNNGAGSEEEDGQQKGEADGEAEKEEWWLLWGCVWTKRGECPCVGGVGEGRVVAAWGARREQVVHCVARYLHDKRLLATSCGELCRHLGLHVGHFDDHKRSIPPLKAHFSCDGGPCRRLGLLCGKHRVDLVHVTWCTQSDLFGTDRRL